MKAKVKTKASSCLSADGNMLVTDGSLTLSSSGSGGKGISVEDTLTINSGEFDIATTGGIVAYVNGTTSTVTAKLSGSGSGWGSNRS